MNAVADYCDTSNIQIMEINIDDSSAKIYS